MESRKITATSEQIAQHEAGPIVPVAFAGDYPAGSEGNGCAAEMVSYLRSVLATTNAAAVLFDLRGLQYTWGDAIGGLALVLLRERAARIRPSAIVASGRTARSLEPLLGPRFILAWWAPECSAPSPRRSIISVKCLDRRLAEGGFINVAAASLPYWFFQHGLIGAVAARDEDRRKSISRRRDEHRGVCDHSRPRLGRSEAPECQGRGWRADVTLRRSSPGQRIGGTDLRSRI
jgi:hypothetical protein